jgi:2-iminobutanoate/2-iminopropanoate deaminase
MSALLPKADIDQHGSDVRVVPLADFGSVQQAGLSPCFGEWAERGGGSAVAELSRTNIMLGRRRHARGPGMIKRIRVEPISTYLERYRKGGVAYPVTIANSFVYLSGLPPFDPESGEIKPQPFERQCELVLEQMKHCLEAAGSSLPQVIKCNVYCVPGPAHFSTFNAVYDRYFPKDAPSRIFMFIHSWPGPFDLEMDCVATV